MSELMKRREFIMAVGGAAVVWPLAARAQQGTMPMIGFVYSASEQPVTHRLRAFREALEGHRLCRGRERGDRIPFQRESN